MSFVALISSDAFRVETRAAVQTQQKLVSLSVYGGWLQSNSTESHATHNIETSGEELDEQLQGGGQFANSTGGQCKKSTNCNDCLQTQHVNRKCGWHPASRTGHKCKSTYKYRPGMIWYGHHIPENYRGESWFRTKCPAEENRTARENGSTLSHAFTYKGNNGLRNEDHYFIWEDNDGFAAYGVFDGHAGHFAAKTVRDLIRADMPSVALAWKYGQPIKPLMSAIFADAHREALPGSSGTTAVVLLLRKEPRSVQVWWLGDSTGKLVPAGEDRVTKQTEDHNCQKGDAGAVWEVWAWRCYGSQVTRDLGVIADNVPQFNVPQWEDWTEFAKEPGSLFLLGSDGLWDVPSNQILISDFEDKGKTLFTLFVEGIGRYNRHLQADTGVQWIDEFIVDWGRKSRTIPEIPQLQELANQWEQEHIIAPLLNSAGKEDFARRMDEVGSMAFNSWRDYFEANGNTGKIDDITAIAIRF